jgi:hypothetical protein
MKMIEDTVVDYPTTGQYDINVWCDSAWDSHDRTVSITFYPLVMNDTMRVLVSDMSRFYTLRISMWPRGPKHKAALRYLIDLVNKEDTFDPNYTEWWSNECVLVDPPELIADFMATLPRKENADV